MKTATSLVFLLSAVASFAEGLVTTASANAYGVLRVETSAAEAIVSVPWLEPSVGDAAIAVTNVLKTANLTAGDELYYYDLATRSYKTWRLTSEKTWEPATLVTAEGIVALGADETLQRGHALLLKRPNDASRASAIYLQGQVASTATAEVQFAKGGAAVSAYTLFAPPSAVDTSLNDADAATWSGVNLNDCIVLADMTLLSWDAAKGAWGLKQSQKVDKLWVTTYDSSKAVIKAGQGAWYVSGVGATTDPKVIWKNLPSVGK